MGFKDKYIPTRPDPSGAQVPARGAVAAGTESLTVEELLRFKSHIDGKNADVIVYPDRVEWAKEGFMGTGAKLALGAATMGVSLLKTGVSGKTLGSEVIPVKSISSVTTKKDGMRFTLVRVICTGNTIDFRVSHSDAEPIKQLLTSLILGSHPALRRVQPQSAPSPASSGSSSSVADEIRKLAELRDAGVLSESEFAVQKTKLLG